MQSVPVSYACLMTYKDEHGVTNGLEGKFQHVGVLGEDDGRLFIDGRDDNPGASYFYARQYGDTGSLGTKEGLASQISDWGPAHSCNAHGGEDVLSLGECTSMMKEMRINEIRGGESTDYVSNYNFQTREYFYHFGCFVSVSLTANSIGTSSSRKST